MAFCNLLCCDISFIHFNPLQLRPKRLADASPTHASTGLHRWVRGTERTRAERRRRWRHHRQDPVRRTT